MHPSDTIAAACGGGRQVAKVVAKAGETRIGRKGLSESSKRVALAKL